MVDFTYRQSIQFVREEKSLSDADKRALLGENAARLYRLKKPAKKRQPVALVTEG
jgi:hypothetical protein